MSTRPSTATPVEHTAWQGWYEVPEEREVRFEAQTSASRAKLGYST
ncbi:hypothetical protein [Glutamicibacter endophyticus]